MKTNYLRMLGPAVFALLLCANLRAQIAISSVEELQKIGNDDAFPLSGSYVLTSDIEIPEGTEWIPIGASNAGDANPAPFTGVFDGQGFSIKTLKISNQSDLKGLFATLTNATVKNLSLEVDINGNRQIGAVTGSLQGETIIERVAVSGNLEGLENVGGITGRVLADNTWPFYNQIRNCRVNARITSRTLQAGGIAGRANGGLLVEKVLVAGTISAAQSAANQNAAGIVAYLTYNLIQFLSSAVVADEITGGSPNLFYSKENSRYLEYFEDLYARRDLVLHYFSDADKGAGAEIVSRKMLLDPERFKRPTFYTDTLRWDFENVWIQGNDGYPTLRKEIQPEIVRDKEKIKIACIGNSITENAPLAYYDKYPTRLQEILGRDRYAVRNYGAGGTCLLKNGANSYWNLPRLTSALRWKPDIVIIKLGTNDTTDANWPLIADFKNDYQAFIDLFKTANPDVEIHLCHPVPVFNNDEKDQKVKQLGQIIQQLAQETASNYVDLYTPFAGKSNLYYDNLHPGPEGTKIIANTLYHALGNTDTRIIYAAPDGQGNGNSWADPADLQTAIQLAKNLQHHQLWLKAGTYTLDAPENPDGINLYGGFNGTEQQLDERDWYQNPTILDGADRHSPLRGRTTTTGDSIPTLIDGIIIQNGLNPATENGGGILTNHGTTIRNTIFRHNQTQNAKNGAAIHLHMGTTRLENCLFVNNTSTANGGAIQVGGNAKAILINCTLVNNQAAGLGGAIGAGANTSHLTLINTLAYNNLASNGDHYNSYAQNAGIDAGGDIQSLHSAIETASAKFTDGDDESHIPLTRETTPNLVAPSTLIGKAPTVADAALANAANYAPASSSLCIDAGQASLAPGFDFDLRKKARIQGAGIDIGAYEYQPITAQATLPSRSPSVRYADGQIQITAAAGHTLKIYDVNGALLHQSRLGNATKNIPWSRKGFHLIKIENQVYKLFIH